MTGRGKPFKAATTTGRGAHGKNSKQSEQKSRVLTTTGARGQNPQQSEKKSSSHHGKGTHGECAEPKKPASQHSKSTDRESERRAVPRTKPPTQESERPPARHTESAPHDRRGSRKKDDPGRVLQGTLEKLKIKRDAKSEASKIKNEIVAKIKTHLDRSENFTGMQTLTTGSYFENLKVCVCVMLRSLISILNILELQCLSLKLSPRQALVL